MVHNRSAMASNSGSNTVCVANSRVHLPAGSVGGRHSDVVQVGQQDGTALHEPLTPGRSLCDQQTIELTGQPGHAHGHVAHMHRSVIRVQPNVTAWVGDERVIGQQCLQRGGLLNWAPVPLLDGAQDVCVDEFFWQRRAGRFARARRKLLHDDPFRACAARKPNDRWYRLQGLGTREMADHYGDRDQRSLVMVMVMTWALMGTPTRRRRVQAPRKGRLTCGSAGAEDGIRTRDPHLGKAMNVILARPANALTCVYPVWPSVDSAEPAPVHAVI